MLASHRSAMIDGTSFNAALDSVRLSTNMSRVLKLLLDGEWHTITDLRAVGGSAGDSRARDLRKERFGSFNVEVCRDTAPSSVFRYRIRPGSVTAEQLYTFAVASRITRA